MTINEIFRIEDEHKTKITQIRFWEDCGCVLEEKAVRNSKELDELILKYIYVKHYFVKENELIVIFETPFHLQADK